jgi:hypothetical protein
MSSLNSAIIEKNTTILTQVLNTYRTYRYIPQRSVNHIRTTKPIYGTLTVYANIKPNVKDKAKHVVLLMYGNGAC